MKLCLRCKDIKEDIEFYTKRKIDGQLTAYCKPCTNKQTTERQRLFKLECVQYMGGSCKFCYYNKYIGALEFHHLDPNEKDFTISQVKNTKFNNKIKMELDKCILLCSNCHKEEHARLRNLDFDISSIIEFQEKVVEKKINTEKRKIIRSKGSFKDLCSCGKEKHLNSNKCKSCHSFDKNLKITWPPIEELLTRLNSSNYSKLARELGVSDNAIRKHIKNRTN